MCQSGKTADMDHMLPGDYEGGKGSRARVENDQHGQIFQPTCHLIIKTYFKQQLLDTQWLPLV